MWPEHCKFCFCGVTHECVSSVFEVLFLFWFVVMSLLSSWYEMDVRVELSVDDVWAAEYDKTCFLSVGVNSFDRLYLKNDQFPCPWCKLVLLNKNMINEDKWEISTNRNMTFFDSWSKYYVWLDPPVEKLENRKISINSFWWILKKKHGRPRST